ASGLAFPATRSIVELTFTARHGADRERREIEDLDRVHTLAELLTISTDVLNRAGADPSRDPRQTLDTGQPALDAIHHQLVPGFAASRFDQTRLVGQRGLLAPCFDATGGDLHDQTCDAAIAHDDVAAATQDRGWQAPCARPSQRLE